MSEPRNINTLTFVFVLFLAACSGESSNGNNDGLFIEPIDSFFENNLGGTLIAINAAGDSFMMG